MLQEDCKILLFLSEVLLIILCADIYLKKYRYAEHILHTNIGAQEEAA